MRLIKIPTPIVPLYTPDGTPFQVPDRKKLDKLLAEGKAIQQTPMKDDDPWTMGRFLSSFVWADKAMSDPKDGNKIKAWRAMMTIDKALEEATEAGVNSFLVRDDHWERVRKVIDGWEHNDDPKAGRPWNDILMMQLLPFLEAWLQAPEHKEE